MRATSLMAAVASCALFVNVHPVAAQPTGMRVNVPANINPTVNGVPTNIAQAPSTPASASGTIASQSFPSNPGVQTQAAPSTDTGSQATERVSEWEPGNYRIYNP